MAEVTGFTADRMLEIENTTVVDGTVVNGRLILLTREEEQIDAGNVLGITMVSHGTDANVPRPDVPGVVYWIGPATPANARLYDHYTDGL